ncbi:MAG: toluene-tolerance protein [Gammaproteobacteria bacterium]|jgi:phospholipid transport system transporter-binding protein|nr:toluene-tolerance protein [Gammaproteobacteria bacterium]
MSQAQFISVAEGQLRLLGAIDYDNAPSLATHFDSYLHTKQRELLLDMSEVTHINSAGMALLISCFRKAKEKGIVLQFCSVPSQLAHIAALTRVDKILNLSQETI